MAYSKRSSTFCDAGSADFIRAVDGLGDRVAILGVSLWATIPPLVPEISGDKLPLVVDTVNPRPWPTDRRANLGGKWEPSDHARGGPFGPPLLIQAPA